VNISVAGIEMGSQSTKLVIREDDRILAAVTLKTGGEGENEVGQAMEGARQQAGLIRPLISQSNKA